MGQTVMKVMGYNIETVITALAVTVAVMLIIVVYLLFSLSSLKGRYRKMMTGSSTGADFEEMLMKHIEETRRVADENKSIKSEIRDINALLAKALTRVGVVRFSAFADMGSDLSYSVALLDSFDNGVVMSSIFAREDSRSYVKPIEGGFSKYTLTKEEQQALREAMATAKR